jgi:hypothetical protein
VSVSIKRDATAPTVSAGSPSAGTQGNNGWYTTNVTVPFTAQDATSGVVGDATQSVTSSGEGDAVQVSSPPFKDNAGNAATAITRSFKIDKTGPTDITFSGVQDYYFGDTQSKPSCDAFDAVSGLASCEVTGGGSAKGTQAWTATATDNAGNVSSTTQDYTVKSWTTKGFYQPVDMSGVLNVVKGGSTVPMKFNVYAGSELTSTSAVKSFTTKAISCSSSAPTDDIETVVTGGTSLKYDTTGGQFVQNWQTPKKPGTCAMATITTLDGSMINASFQFK